MGLQHGVALQVKGHNVAKTQRIMSDFIASLKRSHVFMASDGGTIAVLHVVYMLPTIVKITAIMMLRTKGMGKILDGIGKDIMMPKLAMKNFEMRAPLKIFIHPVAARTIQGTLIRPRIRFSRAIISKTSGVCQPKAFITAISRLLSD